MPPFHKDRTSKWFAYYKSDYNINVTKLKCIWSKYTNYGKRKMNSSSGISKTIYHSGGFYTWFLLL